MQDYRHTAAPIVREFLEYHEHIRRHSIKTVDGYYYDLKHFIGWLHAQERPRDPTAFQDESVDLDLLKKITKSDIYGYLAWLDRDRKEESTSQSRRLSSLKSLFYYLTVIMNHLENDPTQGVPFPRVRESLPRFLTDEQAQKLLDSISGPHELRDTTIILLFMTCGLRVSEMAGLDLGDVLGERIRILGKGNKERFVYLGPAIQEQMHDYLEYRRTLEPTKGHENALFLSQQNKRISIRRLQLMVQEKVLAAGLDVNKISPHKLRHTAATLMLQQGVDVRTVQEVLGHERLDTTQIYTHVTNSDLQLAANAMPLRRKPDAGQ